MSASTASPSLARRAARPAAPGHLRLTRRGRLAVTLTLLALVAVVAVAFAGRSMASVENGAGVATRTVVVERGDTLWAIAAEVAPAGEVREMVHRIQKLNALPDPALAEGQEIAVPVG